mgnify:CR=1 FL=1
MLYDNLPVYKSAMGLCVYIEQIVMGFDRYHKYTIGEDLRSRSKEALFCIHKANRQKDKRVELERLRDKCEEIKMLISLAKELKAFKGFNQFEHSVKLTVNICKQAQSWLKQSAGIIG